MTTILSILQHFPPTSRKGDGLCSWGESFRKPSKARDGFRERQDGFMRGCSVCIKTNMTC